jgi:hypothetical protein
MTLALAMGSTPSSDGEKPVPVLGGRDIREEFQESTTNGSTTKFLSLSKPQSSVSLEPSFADTPLASAELV